MENNTLVMDFYELTMAYNYFKEKKLEEVGYFDMFYRKNPDNGGYTISAGLTDVIDTILNFKFFDEDINYLRSLNIFDEEFLTYLKNFKFNGDIYAIPDGEIVFPNEPLITVKGNIIEAQIIETIILLHKNFAGLITTKASRIVKSANKKSVVDFGARRAHEVSAAVKGAKYAYLGGCTGTACVKSGKMYNIPVVGTMAHSFIEKFDSEYEAFLSYAKTCPNNSTFLVDTYDTLNSGVKNAIKVAIDYLIPNGYRLKGIRLDSGDLAYLSKKARIMLDDASLFDCKIVASNSLDERLISSLENEGAKIDIYGVGENLITAKSDAVLGGVYKLVAIEKNNTIIPKIKLSENTIKITNPGFKKVYRFYDKDTNYALGDVVALADEVIPVDKYTLINPKDEYKQKEITNYRIQELQVKVFEQGHLIYQVPSLDESQVFCEQQLNTIYPEVKRFDNPHEYYVDLSKQLLTLKKYLILNCKKDVTIEEGYQKKIVM